MLQYFNNLPPGAKNILTFNFALGLTGGNLLSGVPTVQVAVLRGTDPNPAAILNGAPAIDSTHTLVFVPVAPEVDDVSYVITVFCPTNNAEVVLDLAWALPVYTLPAGNWSGNCPTYNDPSFRMQFPAFANTTSYPVGSLQFAWNMGANWLSRNQTRWGMKPWQLQQAADLMGAVVTYQLFGPVTSTSNGSQTFSQEGEAPGAVQSATEGTVNATFQLPEIGNSAFSSMLLASPPYGRMLLALLQVAASVGPYIGSRRPAWIPP
jgi:hypothetical protein